MATDCPKIVFWLKKRKKLYFELITMAMASHCQSLNCIYPFESCVLYDYQLMSCKFYLSLISLLFCFTIILDGFERNILEILNSVEFTVDNSKCTNSLDTNHLKMRQNVHSNYESSWHFVEFSLFLFSNAFPKNTIIFCFIRRSQKYLIIPSIVEEFLYIEEEEVSWDSNHGSENRVGESH